MVLWLLLSMIGILIGHRIALIIFKMRLIEEKHSKKIHVLTLFSVLLINFVGQKYQILHFVLLVLLLLSPVLIIGAVQSLRSAQLFILRVSILDALILRIRSGASLKTALNEHYYYLPCWLQPPWKNYFEKSEFQNETTTGLEAKFFAEIAKVEVQRQKQLEKLKALRERYSLQLQFRQKSRQAMYQVRIQGAVLGLFFFGVCCFQVFQSGFVSNLRLFAFAFVLFSLGFYWLMSLGRRYRWKV